MKSPIKTMKPLSGKKATSPGGNNFDDLPSGKAEKIKEKAYKAAAPKSGGKKMV